MSKRKRERAYGETMSEEQNIKAFLMVLREGEGTADEDGYRRMYGGRKGSEFRHFTSFADHPREVWGAPGSQLRSDAAGAYQIMSYTWDDIQKALHLPDFSPESQDKAALWLVGVKRRALDDVKAGLFQRAVAKCANEWASLPGSPYGQPTRTIAHASKVYTDNGGEFAAT